MYKPKKIVIKEGNTIRFEYEQVGGPFKLLIEFVTQVDLDKFKEKFFANHQFPYLKEYSEEPFPVDLPTIIISIPYYEDAVSIAAKLGLFTYLWHDEVKIREIKGLPYNG